MYVWNGFLHVGVATTREMSIFGTNDNIIILGFVYVKYPTNSHLHYFQLPTMGFFSLQRKAM